jgi:hypothetical protein
MSNELATISQNNQIQFLDSVNIDAVKKAVLKINTIQATLRAILVDKKDYGLIPYCGNKPALLKPGAEKIQMALGLHLEYSLITHTENYDDGFFSYTFRAIAKDHNCSIIAEGVGHASSKERKQLTQKDNTVEQKKQTAIDKANAVLKMAKKRAQVDCILTVASLSDVFTQDIEDFNIDQEGLKKQDKKQDSNPDVIDKGRMVNFINEQKKFNISDEAIKKWLLQKGYSETGSILDILNDKFIKAKSELKELASSTKPSETPESPTIDVMLEDSELDRQNSLQDAQIAGE